MAKQKRIHSSDELEAKSSKVQNAKSVQLYSPKS